MWSAQVAALGSHGKVLAPNLPGFGDTPAAEPSVDVWARNLASSLRARGFQKAVFAGCSMGGYVALALLRTDPELVAGIALVGSRAAADTEAQRSGRYAAIERIEREGATPWASEFVQNALSPWTHQHGRDVVGAVREIVLSQPAVSIISAQRALAARPDSTEQWADETRGFGRLIVHGADDKLVPLEEAVALQKRSRTSLVVVRNAGHLAPMEQPKQVSEAIDALWLQRDSS